MKQITLVSFLLIAACALHSCNGEAGKDIVLENIDSLERDSISIGIIDSTENDNPAFFKAKGAQWKIWEAYFKDIVASESWLKSDATYLGMSNGMGAGNLYNKKTGDPALFLISLDTIKAKSVMGPEKVGSGKVMKISGVNLNALLGTDISSTANAQLDAALRSADSSEIAISAYAVETIVDVPFKNLIESDPKFSTYKNAYTQSKYRVIAQALKVKGFTATANLSRTIDFKLKAKLDSGKVIGKLSDTNADLKFSTNGSKKVVATSNSEFYVFGKLIKAKHL